MNFESIINTLKGAAKRRNKKVYLVGGFIRDFFIKKRTEFLEMDFAVDGAALGLANEVAEQLKGAFVPLDLERGIFRVTSKGKYELDFNEFKSETIESDLKVRDFTINAMACDIERIQNVEDIKEFLLDPCLGRQDIQNKLIRVTNPNSFTDDPLRILRAFAQAAAFGFEIESNTFSLINASILKLSNVAGERIRDELSRLFETQRSTKYIQKMDEIKILDEIFPEIRVMRGTDQGSYHHLDIWQHSIESLAQLESFLDELEDDKNLAIYLSTPITDVRKTIWLVKLAALLHDLGKPQAREVTESGKIRFHGHETKGAELIEPIAERLRLSTREGKLLEDIVLYHLRPAQLANSKDVTKRAVFRLLRDMGDSTPAVCLITVADKKATQGKLMKKDMRDSIEVLCLQLIGQYFDMKTAKAKPKRLLTGDDIIETLQIPPGRIIGVLLKEIEESQAEGTIKTRDEALKLAKKIYEEMK